MTDASLLRGVRSRPSTYWVATASGGLLKTTNNGVTSSIQFDKKPPYRSAMLRRAFHRNIVWVGTGENNTQFVSYGDGVYKIADGGKSWKNMGLGKSFQIGRSAIHPKNSRHRLLGALGRLYGPHPERGPVSKPPMAARHGTRSSITMTAPTSSISP